MIRKLWMCQLDIVTILYGGVSKHKTTRSKLDLRVEVEVQAALHRHASDVKGVA